MLNDGTSPVDIWHRSENIRSFRRYCALDHLDVGLLEWRSNAASLLSKGLS
ncbi:hypothetical protein [Bosea sp. UC22_33]|uniref:hypothetical protein n=1 Tax=Bosea sp. UC22_33 TaxID=3350165 RepID=UPI00366D0FCD